MSRSTIIPASRRGKRILSTVVLAVLGGAITVATWVGGDHVTAVGTGVFYVVMCTLVFAWSGRSGDVAAIMRVDGDERQRSLDHDATALSALGMGSCAIIGAIVQLARGENALPYLLVAAVGGLSYIIALSVLRARH